MLMRAKLWWVIAALTAAVIMTGGCPKKVQQAADAVRTAQDAQDGSFTVKGEKGEEVKVETDKSGDGSQKTTVVGPEGQKSTTEVGEDAVSEEDIGVAFYPGAEVESGGKSTVSGEGGGSIAQVTLTSQDALDKVAKFYKDKYAEGNTVMDSPDSCVIIFNEGENQGKVITVTPDKGAGITRIAIAAAAGT